MAKRRWLSWKDRFVVLQRDGFACRYCGQRAPSVELQVDHVVPVARGGTNKLSNLAAACRGCNAGKRDLLIDRPFMTVFEADEYRSKRDAGELFFTRLVLSYRFGLRLDHSFELAKLLKELVAAGDSPVSLFYYALGSPNTWPEWRDAMAGRLEVLQRELRAELDS